MWRQNIHRAAHTQQVTGKGRGKTVGGLTAHQTWSEVIDDTARYALLLEGGGHTQQRLFRIELSARWAVDAGRAAPVYDIEDFQPILLFVRGLRTDPSRSTEVDFPVDARFRTLERVFVTWRGHQNVLASP